MTPKALSVSGILSSVVASVSKLLVVIILCILIARRNNSQSNETEILYETS